MIVVIDDAGDPGLKLGKGSSNYFLIAAVCFEDDLDAEEVSLKIKKLRKRLGWKSLHEFKFRKTSPEIRRRFLNEIKNCDFKISLVIIDKRQADKSVFGKKSSEFYDAVILQAISGFDSELVAAHVYIDGESGKNYRKNVKTFFRKELPKGAIRELTYRNSKNDNLIQLADMVVGAARRSVERDKDGDYLKIVKKRIVKITKNT